MEILNYLGEEWRDIKGYEGLYQVSSLGRVKSLDRIVVYSNGRVHLHKSKIVKPNMWKYYYRIGLYNKEQTKFYAVHRLVYETFVGPIPEGMQVNHINEIKTDNRLENLNLMTPKENHNWGTGIQRASKQKKKHLLQLDLNGNEIFGWFSLIDCQTETGYEKSAISRCCNGTQKTAYGFRWRYAS